MSNLTQLSNTPHEGCYIIEYRGCRDFAVQYEDSWLVRVSLDDPHEVAAAELFWQLDECGLLEDCVDQVEVCVVFDRAYKGSKSE